ncbi:16S rRNA (guanine(527)-N(7))-methyltransferase RsmG [Sphingomonas sp. GCM10030256]|uniref:16S rRNA (guanine(527)-N(7))-methyltransferase RsmG n=1 Tax=Sphingomonas sp. GCM10030256 TaxID=3273427 RepID=UPI003618417E
MIDRLREFGVEVSRETERSIAAYAELLLRENQRQNLISKSSENQLRDRHILDSAQLVRFAPRPDSSWLDIGAGPGLPGIVIALLTSGPVTLVEPRRLRVEFLEHCVGVLKLRDRVTVCCGKAEAVRGTYDVITARAVATIDKLFAMSVGLAHQRTRWILPKGRSGAKELADARANWQGRFSTEPSITDGQAVIVVAEGVKPRGRG